MKVSDSLLICLILTGTCLSQVGTPADTQQRADQVSKSECVHLSIRAAREALEEADRGFIAADVKSAHKAVDATVHYASRSVDCSLRAPRSEKGAEIDLRGLIRRMKDISKTVDSEDRPHLLRSLTELEKQRDRLLQAMFGTAAGGGTREKKP